MNNMVRSFPKLAANVSSDISKKYEVWWRIQEAVKMLNTLQSNAQTIQKIRKERNSLSHLNIPNMVKYAERAGISLDDIDSLNVIHVSGTKGKGSTCAFTESILRQYGYSTGFFSSPHLVEVRERFRINGSPLSRDKFAHYFWDVYHKLEASKHQHNGAMPAYFAFCTIMAFHVFLQEKIDVAIVEVGIGGQYDSTNLIRKPVVCGVASLGLDHTSILGNTIEKIAWHKSGIFKSGVPAFTAPQVSPALQVIRERAEEIGSPLHKVLPLQDLNFQGRKLEIGIEGSMQMVNAALAMQLSKTWIENRERNARIEDTGEMENGVQSSIPNAKESSPCIPECEPFAVTENMHQGLAMCSWAGRNQSIKKQRLTYYLDGAHTFESIQQCVEWFKTASAKEAKTIRGKVVKVIVFNTTGDRDPSVLIAPLTDCQFDLVAFCPNIAFSNRNTLDLTNNTVTTESQHARCLLNKEFWIKVHQSRTAGAEFSDDVPSGTSKRTLQNGNANGQTNGSNKRLKVDHNDDDISQTEDQKSLKSSNGVSLDLGNGESKSVINGESEDPLFHNISCEQATCDSRSIHSHDTDVISQVFPSIFDALKWATQGRDQLVNDDIKLDLNDIPEDLRDPAHIQVLVTGSLHLVGGVLRAVGPDYNS
ncbi:folylpolyglutamate synthase, mitochondrial-like isoform X2 [Mizuhopecten yessoensis]|uniref:folylpolyglutamate synthase, mitochondrial-like isoform X2 n=1 Tax=Mizuhopecten yessoensis TaxID=6573 RepID=UPI000B45C7DF|nr:folylpolyglutamate synthase, mitochondrial-like isoform X2 [Mizuhopecten yessoensis]